MKENYSRIYFISDVVYYRSKRKRNFGNKINKQCNDYQHLTQWVWDLCHERTRTEFSVFIDTLLPGNSFETIKNVFILEEQKKQRRYWRIFWRQKVSWYWIYENLKPVVISQHKGWIYYISLLGGILKVILTPQFAFQLWIGWTWIRRLKVGTIMHLINLLRLNCCWECHFWDSELSIHLSRVCSTEPPHSPGVVSEKYLKSFGTESCFHQPSFKMHLFHFPAEILEILSKIKRDPVTSNK